MLEMNSAGVQIVILSILFTESRSSSPETIYSHLASITHVMNLSSSGSRHNEIEDDGIMYDFK